MGVRANSKRRIPNEGACMVLYLYMCALLGVETRIETLKKATTCIYIHMCHVFVCMSQSHINCSTTLQKF